jgi:hypothetical protein
VKRLAVAAFVLLAPVTALAGPLSPPQEDPLTRGRTEIGVHFVYGHAMNVWGGLPDSEFLTFGVTAGHVLTPPVFAGPCRGNLVIAGEFSPAIAFHEDTRTTYASSAGFVLRLHFNPGARVRPFISAGGGVVFSSRPIPHDISRVNFTPQGGAGVTVALRHDALLSIEYRIHHMSDGILTDYNPGANSNAVQVGVSWMR